MGGAQPEEEPASRDRRGFLGNAAIDAGAAAAAAAGLGAFVLSRLGPPSGPPPWDLPDGTVDFSLVPTKIEDPVFRVAQWYDHGPGNTLRSDV